MNDCQLIIDAAIKAADPYDNVVNALSKRYYEKNVTVIAVGKAACSMAKAAYDVLGENIIKGYVLTKYGHCIFPLPSVFTVREAGHPVPDENSVKYTSEIVAAAKKLDENDKILFLLSGGASSLFENPSVSLDLLRVMTEKLLRCSADITEINTIRKRLSNVKGGKFALMCKCSIDCCILSDVLGDRLDMIASGPCCADLSTTRDVVDILEKYSIELPSDTADERRLIRSLFIETPKNVSNVTSFIAGNIEMLCRGAAQKAKELGFNVCIETLSMTGEASEKGREIARKAICFSSAPHEKTVFIYGGETTVTINGSGKGGRNQELILSAAIELKDAENIEIFSLGSDGTDGPTDAAGGIADGTSYSKMLERGIVPEEYLADNNSYNALKTIDSLIITGPTMTNVNDITVVIIK